MPIDAACENPQCGITVTLDDKLAGKRIRCPRCGGTIEVPRADEVAAQPAPRLAPEPQPSRGGTEPTAQPAGEEHFLAMEGEDEEAARAARKQGAAHPAATECPSCGEIMGPGHKFCTKCGADIRTGVLAETKDEGPKRNVWKALVPAVLVLAALAAGGWFGWDYLQKRKAEPEGAPKDEREAGPPAERRAAPEPTSQLGQRTPPTAQRQTEPVPRDKPPSPKQLPKPAKFELPPLSAELQEIKEAVGIYMGQLAVVAGARETVSQEEMAARWARLSILCRAKGLESEARMCWLRAALLNPRDEKTNLALGRTAGFKGVPVTPEQKAYLDARATRIEVVNRDSKMGDLRIGLEGERPRALPPSQSSTVGTGAGTVTLVLQVGPPEQESTARLSVGVPEGECRRISLIGDGLAPLVGVSTLGHIGTALGGWRQYHEGDTVTPEATLAKLGWQKGNDYWDLTLRDKKVVRFRTDFDDTLRSVACGGISLARVDEGDLTVSLKPGTATIKGRLFVPGEGNAMLTLLGTEELPIVLEPAGEGVAWVRTGVWEREDGARTFLAGKFEGEGQPEFAYMVETLENDVASEVLSALNGELGAQARQTRIEEHRQALLAEMEDLEARAELLGSWHSELWLSDELKSTIAREERRAQWEQQARLLPLHADRLAELGIEDRSSHLYLQWPLFREALLSELGRKASEMAERGPVGAAPPERRTGPLGRPTGGPPMTELQDPRVPPGRPGGRPVPGRRPVMEAEKPVEIAAIDLMALMPDAAAVAFLDRRFATLQAPGQIVALGKLRLMTGAQVVGLLHRIARGTSEAEVRGEALLILGEIGTREALAQCRTSVLDAGVEGARLAALAACGDTDAVAQLPDTLQGALPETKAALLKYLLRAQSPSAMIAIGRALDSYGDEASRLQIAQRLGQIGGHAAMSVLARLMEEQNDAYGPVLQQVQPSDMLLLIEPLSRMLAEGTDRSRQVAFLMARSRLPAAVPPLKAAAVEGHLPFAAVALAAFGSAESLEAAGQTKDLIDPADVQTIRAYWRREATPELEWAWAPGVNATVAVAFLQGLLREGDDPQLRIAAAELLQQVGARPDVRGLLTLAAVPVPRARPPAESEQETPSESRTTPRGRGGRRGSGAVPNMPVMMMEQQGPGRPGLRRPGQMPEAEEPAGPLAARRQRQAEVAATPQMRAVKLLDDQVGPDLGPALRELAEGTSDVTIKAGVLKLLGKAADHESKRFLLAAAGPASAQYAKTSDMLDHAELQAAAAAGIGRAADPELAAVLHDLIVSPPPDRSVAFEREPSEADYGQATKERLMLLVAGAREALTALPRGQTLWHVSRDKPKAALVANIMRRIAADSSQARNAEPGAAEVAADAITCLGRTGNLPRNARDLLQALVSMDQVDLPIVMRRAVFDALCGIGDATASRQIASLLPGTWAQPELGAHWRQLCPILAARGAQHDYDRIRESLPALGGQSLTNVVAMMSFKHGDQPLGYYDVLARLAGDPVEPEQIVTTTRPGARPQPRQELPQQGPGPRSRSASRNASPAARSAPVPVAESPLEMVRFRWRCLKLLCRGPADKVDRLLTDERMGLLGGSIFGQHAALVLKRHSPGYDMVGYLKWRYAVKPTAGERRAVIAVARKLASPEMAEMLGEFLLPPQAAAAEAEKRPEAKASTQRTGQPPRPPGHRPASPADDQPLRTRSPGSRQETAAAPVDVTPFVARALGSLGRLDILQKAFRIKVSGRVRVYAYPASIRAAALEGIAYLPSEEESVAALEALKGKCREHETKRAIEEAILEVYRLRAATMEGAQGEPDG